MLHHFFMTQWYNETPGDWTEQIKVDLKDLGIPCNFEKIKSKSKYSFKKLVKIKSKEYALKILTEKQKKHSKMKNLYYKEMKIQEYFKIEGISTKQVQNLFKWRVRMALLGENFRGNEKYKICPLCSLHLDNQNLVFKCDILKKEMNIECREEDLYIDDIELKTAVTITEIELMREKVIKAKKTTNESMLPSGPCAQYCAQYSVSAAKTAILS